MYEPIRYVHIYCDLGTETDNRFYPPWILLNSSFSRVISDAHLADVGAWDVAGLLPRGPRPELASARLRVHHLQRQKVVDFIKLTKEGLQVEPSCICKTEAKT